MNNLYKIAEDMTREIFGNEIEVGKYYLYSPNGQAEKKGYLIKIIGGFFLDPIYHRLSNHWAWKRVKKDGSLGDEIERGYGGGREFFYPINFYGKDFQKDEIKI